MRARQREWMVGVAGLGVSIAVFAIWPGLDVWLTQFFYSAASHSFPANQSPWVHTLYVATPWLTRTVFVVSCLVLLYFNVRPQSHLLVIQRRLLAWVIMAVVGLGVVVDWGLKDNVGRPRPEQLEIFGHSKPFVPAFELSAHCDVNCGFVSGHAAAGFSVMAWGMWSTWSRRKRWLLAATTAGLVIGAVRIVQGGHFLSDVIFAGWAVWLSYQAIRQTWLLLRLRRYKRTLLGEIPLQK